MSFSSDLLAISLPSTRTCVLEVGRADSLLGSLVLDGFMGFSLWLSLGVSLGLLRVLFIEPLVAGSLEGLFEK